MSVSEAAKLPLAFGEWSDSDRRPPGADPKEKGAASEARSFGATDCMLAW